MPHEVDIYADADNRDITIRIGEPWIAEELANVLEATGDAGFTDMAEGLLEALTNLERDTPPAWG